MAEQSGYRPDIDGLRAIAVVSVVLFHANIAAFSGGFVGVDIFFVISGYLITKLIKLALDENTFSILRFYERRVRRIIPALIVVLAFTTAVSTAVAPPAELRSFGQSAIATALFYSNFYFAGASGYFDGAAISKPLLHTWSLSIEEQFYVFWPVFLLVLYQIGKPRSLLIALSVAIGIGSLAYAQLTSAADDPRYFFLPYGRAWELLLGALLALKSVPPLRAPWQRDLAATLGLALIVYSVVGFSSQTPFPSLWTLLPCAGAALLIHAGEGSDYRSVITRCLSLRPVVAIGLISYSLYLWHWPIFSFAHSYLQQAPSGVEVFLLVTTSMGAAALSWRYVEQPFRRPAPQSALRPAATVATGMGGLLACALAGLLLVRGEGLPGRLDPELLRIYNASKEINPLRKNCHTRTTIPPDAAKCTIPTARQSDGYEILMWGDSHADMLFPAAEIITKKLRVSARQATRGGCPPLVGAERITVEKKDARIHHCKEFNDNMLKLLQRGPRPQVAILAGRWSLYTDSRVNGPTSFLVDEQSQERTYQSSTKVLERSLRRTLTELDKLGIRTIIFGQPPEFSFEPYSCYVRKRMFGADATTCIQQQTSAALSMLETSHQVLSKVAGEFRSVGYVPLHPLLCDAQFCWALNGDMPLYSDDNHVSIAVARMAGQRALNEKVFEDMLGEK